MASNTKNNKLLQLEQEGGRKYIVNFNEVHIISLKNKTKNNGTRWPQWGHFNPTSWQFLFVCIQSFLPVRQELLLHPFSRWRKLRHKKQLSVNNHTADTVEQGIEPRRLIPESIFLNTLLGNFFSPPPKSSQRPWNGSYQLLSTYNMPSTF